MRQEIDFTGKRIRHFSALSFDDVVARLRARVGVTTVGEVVSQTGAVDDFEANVRKNIGSSGFTLFSEIDHGRWIQKYGIHRRLVRWIFGNPLIAITMIRHDYTAGLFAPIELLIAESDDAKTCNITYVLPSSLIAVGDNAELRKAALALDAKLEALIESAVAV